MFLFHETDFMLFSVMGGIIGTGTSFIPVGKMTIIPKELSPSPPLPADINGTFQIHHYEQ